MSREVIRCEEEGEIWERGEEKDPLKGRSACLAVDAGIDVILRCLQWLLMPPKPEKIRLDVQNQNETQLQSERDKTLHVRLELVT